jgi:hypothetical protein
MHAIYVPNRVCVSFEFMKKSTNDNVDFMFKIIIIEKIYDEIFIFETNFN